MPYWERGGNLKEEGADGEEEVEWKRRKHEETKQKVLQTREALEKQKQNAELDIQEEEEKMRHIIQNREDTMKEHVQQKKTCPEEGSRNKRMQKTSGRSPFGQTEWKEEEQRHLQAEH